MKKKIITIICLIIAVASMFYLLLEMTATIRYGGQMERIIPRLAYEFWGRSNDPCILYGCPDPNYKPYDDECMTAGISPVNFSLKRIIYVVKPGDNLWDVLDFNLRQQSLFQRLKTEEEKIVLGYLEDRMNEMTPEEIQIAGISSGNINKLTTGDKINIAPYFLDIKELLKKTGINLLEYRSSNIYSKNDRHVCWSNKLVFPPADPDSFVAFNNLAGQDKKHVYFNGYFVEGADPKNFEFFSGSYSRDERNIYYDDGSSMIKIDGADSETFELWKGNYYKDKNYVYNSGQKLGGVNPDESIIIDDAGTYLRFRNLIYAGPWLIGKADADTFQVLENGYSKDGHAVYYGNRRVSGAVPDSFRVVTSSDHDAEDNNNVYWSGFPGPRNQ
jgi:hypothetical protein